jgi:hypothetical protein
MGIPTKLKKDNYVDQILQYPKNYIIQFDIQFKSIDNTATQNILHVTSNRTDMDITDNANPRNPAIFLKNGKLFVSIYAGSSTAYEYVSLELAPETGFKVDVLYAISLIVKANEAKLMITNRVTKKTNIQKISNSLLGMNTEKDSYLYVSSPWAEPCDAFISNLTFIYVDTYNGLNIPVNNLDTVTNKLLLKYDDKFNELYNEKMEIDKEIMNKEEIFIQLNEEMDDKEKQIRSLQIILLALFVLSILLILYVNRQLLWPQYWILTLFFLILFSVLFYLAVLRQVQKKIIKAADMVGKGMKDYIQRKIPNWKCPSNCESNTQEEEDEVSVDVLRAEYGVSSTLRTDSQNNVWRYGDVPTDLYTSEEGAPYPDMDIPNYADPGNIPQPFFRGLKDNYLTYYQCSWMGGDVNDIVPSSKNRENTFSSIPCSYRPNYKESGRYICSKNPNNDYVDKGTIPSYCVNVSSYS